ncbi:MAG: glycosyltransferase [Bacteriovorax sp.]|nr:glycosyltransferase [Bacteriovorax sp.]
MKKIKIARVVTVPIVYTHILDLLRAISSDPRFELHIICSEGQFLKELKLLLPNAIFHCLEIPREINIKKDLKALWLLVLLYWRERFDIVHSLTPKAGFTNALAGFIARVPVRIHTYTGQVWVTLRGSKRDLLIWLDRVIAILNTQNYTDSLGQKKFLLESKIGNDKSLSVLHKGSLGGINTERFDYVKLESEIKKLKKELFPNFTGKILIFLGRMNHEKGLYELVEAFDELKKKFAVKLLLVGPMESEGNPLFSNLINKLQADSDVVLINFTATPEYYLGVGDIFCFPSYREGFGTVALEASAMKKPIVASNIYGLADAVADNTSGLLFEARNAKDLTSKIERLLLDEPLAAKLGEQGRERVINDFSDKIMTKKMIDEYLALVKR